MQYTIRKIPERLDRAIRERARREGKSLNRVTIEALMQAFGLDGENLRRRDLSDLAGTWKDDPETEQALAEQRRIEVDLWS
ncbi:MAG: FitA-like ribbon-helix-helix domain-containing protein [Gemmatimonadota bacterium]